MVKEIDPVVVSERTFNMPEDSYPHSMISWCASDDDDDINFHELFYMVERVHQSSLKVTFQDGRTIWIENEEGQIRVHVYDGVIDTPLNLNIDVGSIEVNRGDYDTERDGL